MSSFYDKFIKTGRKGYSLKGGPFAKWRYPLNKVLYRKRLDAGPEPERPRSIWSNWNYDSELYAFGKRLNEEFKVALLQQAFTHPSYAIAQKSKLQELGIEFDATNNNLNLSREGEKICKYYLKAVLNFWYPNLPEEGVEAVVEYLLDTKRLAIIAKNVGIKDLIKSKEFPLEDETLEDSLFAVIGALNQSSNVIRAHLFINDFILTELIGNDINEIWKIKNPMGLLIQELNKRGHTSLPVSRLLWSTGSTTPTAAFIVGIYIDEKFISKGSGETVEIAEEMAARDALRRIFGTTEESAPLPYGDRARKYSQMLCSIYEKLVKKNE